MTARPHDALFKLAFEAPHGAAALLRALLPPAVRDAIAWEALALEPGSFVDARLRDHHNDLLFSAPLRTGDPDLVYLLLEHQSTLDPSMALRCFTYQTRIWVRFRKERPGARLPPILAVLVSHAPGGWTAPRAFEELLDPRVLALPGLAPLVPRCSILVEDLARRSDDDLAARALPPFQKVALWLLRDARDPARLLADLTIGSPMMEAGLGRLTVDELTVVINYLLEVIEPAYLDDLRAKIHELGTHSEEIAMTIAEYLREEGREEGRKEGRKEGRIDMLRTQLRFKFQALDAASEARLQAATSEAIDRYVQRVLTADSLAAVFED